MALEIRPVPPDKLALLVEVLEETAGRRLSGEVLEDVRATYDPTRILAAFDGSKLIAGTGSERLELTLPGPTVIPAVRITHTGVIPTHRRGHVALELLAHQLRDLHARHEKVAMFTTSGPGIYRPIGYAPASRVMEAEIETHGARLRVPTETETVLRLSAPDEWPAILPDVFARHRRAQPGQVLRTDAFWAVWLLDRARYRPSNAGERFAVVAEDRAGEVRGYVTYRLIPGHPRDQPVQSLVVEDLIASDGGSARALRSYCLGFHQARSVCVAHLPLDDPLQWMLADPRRLRIVRVRDFLWLRLLAIENALTSRKYWATDELVLEITDTVLPTNSGRYRLATTGSNAWCERTRSPAELHLDVADLAAVYLGGATFNTLARAGLVQELSPGALTRADTVFSSAIKPWTVADW